MYLTKQFVKEFVIHAAVGSNSFGNSPNFKIKK